MILKDIVYISAACVQCKKGHSIIIPELIVLIVTISSLRSYHFMSDFATSG